MVLITVRDTQGLGIGTQTALHRSETDRVPFRVNLLAIGAARAGGGAGDYYLMDGRDVLAYAIDPAGGTWSIQFQGSMDGLFWLPVAAAITVAPAALVVVKDLWFKYLDVAIAWTAGAPNLHFALLRSG